MNTVETTIDTDTLQKKSERIGSFVGKTPLFPIHNIAYTNNVTIFSKLEWQQFGGSIKSRPAYRIMDDAIKSGKLQERTLLDASSGNTGIAYGHICAALGIPLKLCLPENASEERKQILRALGVDLKLTTKSGGTDKAQEMAKGLKRAEPTHYFYADQYSNPSNWKAHYDTTGPEIWDQTNGKITHFVAGLGTTGTFTGTGKFLKEKHPDIKLVGLQPDIAMHGLEGWKHLETAHTPEIYDDSIADEIRTVSTDEAYDLVKHVARKEGLLISPSSAANLAGALQVAKEVNEGVIVTVFPDDGSKYGEVMNQLF